MKDKCTYWKKYKAVRKPVCGCQYCLNLWNQKAGAVAHEYSPENMERWDGKRSGGGALII